MSSIPSSVPSVIVSNGTEFFEIDSCDLETARSDGFYLPRERGMTIVSNGDEIFEVTLEDAKAAKAEGFRDLVADLAVRHRKNGSPAGRRKKKKRAQGHAFAGLPIGPTVDDSEFAIDTGTDDSLFQFDSVALQTSEDDCGAPGRSR